MSKFLIACVLAGACGFAAATTAIADSRVDAIMAFCQAETGAPTRLESTLEKAPDGKLRGTRSGAVLYAEARNAVRAGGHENELQGVRWILLCVSHDRGSWDHVANNNQAVIDYLRSH